MREENRPGIAEPLMKADLALRGFRFEIWCDFAK
jgi:hypothetical protein